MLDSTIKLFKEEFGESIDENYDKETFIAVSANRWLALVQLNKLHEFYLTFRRFMVQNIPKPDKEKIEIIKYKTLFFNFKIVRRIVELFFKNNGFEIATNIRNGVNVLVFKFGEHGIVLAEMEEKDVKKFFKYEINYNWNDIFSEFTVQDDMIL